MEKSQNIKIKSAFTYLFIYNFSWIWNTFSKEFLRFYEVLTNTSSRQLVTYILYIEFIIGVCPYCSLSIFIFPAHFEDDLIIYIYIYIYIFCIKAELKIMIITITWTKNLHRISKTFPGDLIHTLALILDLIETRYKW